MASLIRAIAPGLWAITTVLGLPVVASAEDQPAKADTKPALIAVRVVDEKGSPRADAQVHLGLFGKGAGDLRSTGERPFVSAKCDADGWAVFGGVEAGGAYYLLLVCQPEGFFGEVSSHEDQTLKAGRNEYTVVYPTRNGAKVGGVLLDKDKKPLVGVTVRMAPRNWVGVGRSVPGCEAMRCQPSCTSDGKRGFLFNGLDRFTRWYVVAVVRDYDVLFAGQAFSVGREGTVDLGELVTDLDSKGMKPVKEPEKKEDAKVQEK